MVNVTGRPDSRKKARHPCSEEVRISWEDRLGDTKFARARCLDVSEHGLALQLVEPIQVCSYVNIRADKLKLAGRAAVRYCRRVGGKFFVGLEFSAGLKYCCDDR
jgi:hypothetical protein